MTNGAHFEFPGFRIPEAPVFNGADATAMFAGDIEDPIAMLDLAMVFGSRLWGHEAPPTIADTAPIPAPGVGDLYAHELRDRACAALCERVAYELSEDSDAWRALVLHTGSEAVETAIKTALRATGRSHLAAFEGGYHGTFGLALAVTHGSAFRDPWAAQYAGDTVRWTAWGETPTLDDGVACVIVEPWQGRAGVVPPPDGFHAAVRAECDRVGALLILDAVLCGAGRTGDTIAECIAEARPDIVCLGKAIGCGAVASAVVARREVAESAWARGDVEPAHTSTSLGAPAACSGILLALERLEMRAEELRQAAADWAAAMDQLAVDSTFATRGIGFVWALETGAPRGGIAMATRLRADHRIIVVPSGSDGSSITIYPAATTTRGERERFLEAIIAVRMT